LFSFILAFIGYRITHSFFGGLIGFLLGGYVDRSIVVYGQAKAKARSEGRRLTPDDLFQYYKQRTSQNDVGTIIMALSAAIMKADGKVVKSELDYVKAFIRQNFGEQNSSNYLQTLKHFLDSGDIPMDQICDDVRTRMQPEVRVQIIHYLFGIAKADGSVSESELNVLNVIASMMGVASVDFESVKNMFYRNADSDYKILGIEASATDDEVKKAYRQMAIKFHPDKVASMGEEYEKGAKEKFQQIQEAYDNLKKSRGIK
jgi:DnaJ like chaperone protein